MIAHIYLGIFRARVLSLLLIKIIYKGFYRGIVVAVVGGYVQNNGFRWVFLQEGFQPLQQLYNKTRIN